MPGAGRKDGERVSQSVVGRGAPGFMGRKAVRGSPNACGGAGVGPGDTFDTSSKAPNEPNVDVFFMCFPAKPPLFLPTILASPCFLPVAPCKLAFPCPRAATVVRFFP
jgi:hypothetical protein